jgi:hypothetical protein
MIPGRKETYIIILPTLHFRAPFKQQWHRFFETREEAKGYITYTHQMIIEERMYTLHFQKVPEFMEIYDLEGLPIIKAILAT